DGSTSLGTADVESGTATLTTSALAAGDHSLTAVFTPEDETAYTASTSDAVSYTVATDSGSDDVSGATLEWGFKQSFLSYITGAIANGNIATSGVSTNDSNEFVWSNGSGTYDIDTQTGEVSYSGSVHFTGHDGALDITLSNPRIVVTGETTATLYLDVVSKGYNGSADVDETDVPFATLTLPAGVQADDGAITWTDAAAVLTSDGATAFAGFYSAGTVLDPVTFTFPASSSGSVTPVLSSDTTSVAPGDTITFTATGLDAYESVDAEVHSAVVDLGSFTVVDGGVTIAWTVPTDFDPGTHTLLLLDADGNTIASASFVVTAVSTDSGTGTDTSSDETTTTTTEDVCVANSVSGATISWGFKQSFVDYINGPIANGEITGGWGTGSGAYSVDNHSGSVRYSGSVHYYGHSGILDITLSNLRIQVTSATTAVLYVTTSSTGEIALANLTLPTASSTGSSISWSNASATITSAGSALFSYNGNAFYPAGTALDSVTFSFPLGAEVACDSTTDGTLASTGGSDANGMLWIGLTMMALGVGAVALRRRRAARA
ncbi:MAG: HtaA domain-containing protein, partial [Microbacterium sp.]|uniref:HtaA domain-containing protein n=1 Tax=Microbacterium sp. TaxID=51671 RepID=UPI0039E2F77F